MQPTRWTNRITIFAALMLMALPLIVRFWQDGMINAGDAEIHLHRIVNGAVGMSNGDFYPRWSYYLHHGFGYPLFNFYAPGVYLGGGLIQHITGAQTTLVYTLILTFAALLYPAGAYALARTFSGQAGALLAAAVYTYAPFRFYELWVQQNLPQFVAAALVPLILWAVTAAVRSSGWRRVSVAAFLLAALVLAHHVTAFIAAPFIALWAVVTAMNQPQRWQALLRAAAVGMVALLLSAIYWLPALGELSYTQINTIQDSQFDPLANFLPPDLLLATAAPVDLSQLNWDRFGGGFTPVPGLVAFGVVLLAVPALFVRAPVMRRVRPLIALSILTFFGAISLVTPVSAAVWDNLPLIGYVQFPWRLLILASVATIPCAAALPYLLPEKTRAAGAGLAIVLTVAAVLPLMYAPVEFEERRNLTPESAIRYEARTGNMGLTASNEYLPIWAGARPQSGMTPERYERFAAGDWFIAIDAGTLGRDVELIEQPAPSRSSHYRITAPDQTTIRLMQLYFPGFTVLVNGEPVEISAEPENGRITFTLPAGTSEILIRYDGTPLQHSAALISLAGLIVAVILLVLPAQSASNAPEERSTSLAVVVAVGFAAFVLVNQAYIVPSTELFRLNSDPSQPPAQQSINATYDDLLQLAGYDLPVQQAAAGDTVRVNLYWTLLQDTERSLSGSVQLVDITGAAAEAEETHFNLASINTRSWTVNQYVVDTYRLHIPPGTPPFVYDVKAVVFDENGRLNAANGDAVTLAQLRVTGDYVQHDALPEAQITLGDIIRVDGLRMTQESGERCLFVRWHVLQNPPEDYQVLLHQYDADGELITAADTTPFAGAYPTSLWAAGQTLDDAYCFTAAPDAAQIALGLYNAGGVRLPASSDNATIVDNTIRLEPD